MIFVKEKPYRKDELLNADYYNHCPSICPHKDGVLIAWYSGEHECHDKQQVNVIYYKDGKYSEKFNVGVRTGNPVIWAITKKKACLLYSYFERLDVSRLVSRWKYCSNWTVQVEYKPDRKTIWASYIHIQMDLDPPMGCLGRCQPIKVKKEWLLPLYQEHDPCGIIMTSKDGLDWSERGRIGISDHRAAGTRFGKGLLMQPTLWSDGSRLFALCRNIARTGSAWFSQSYDMGQTWSEPSPSGIPNQNNSLVAMHDGTENPWIIWNEDRKRRNLVLGKLDGTSADRLFKLNTIKGAYPNYCVDSQERIHLVHSDGYAIRHHILNQAWLNALKAGESMAEVGEDDESSSEDLEETSQP